ncbi:AAA family ATPase [Pseudorhodoferax sp. Leaf267]|uniref:AAA family ATPase n=1 Tax=Pseudorhodoferax sp. Leaf267 TaxID=1736316 RepID=UPI0009E99E77|nr:AAA family ATPase [Pseudorhodoferax sp. Leaf267]
MDALTQFRDAMVARDLIPPDRIDADGQLHRCDVKGKHGKNDGAYVLHLDGIPCGGFQNHKDGLDWQKWRADVGRALTVEEQAAERERIAAIQSQRERDDEGRRLAASIEASGLVAKSKAGAPEHPYIIKKGIKSHGLRIVGANLIVPAKDVNGKLHTVQRIGPDGSKLFLSGGRKTGCMFLMGRISDIVIVVEGFATGATVREATGHPVAVAFDAGNLTPVALALHDKYPEAQIVIGADDDAGTDGNPGTAKALEAAERVGGKVVLPNFREDRPAGASDFNDLHLLHGLDAVRACFETVATPAQHSVILTCGADLVPTAVRWMWPNWLALGKLHILAGSPGQGKTTLAVTMAATVTIGGQWPDGSRCDAGNILIWSGEDDAADTLLPRLMAAGGDKRRCFFITGAKRDGEVVPFDPARDLGQLQAAIQRIGGIRLLVVDPVVSAVAGDSHKNTEVRRALQPLVDLAASCDCAVLGITHFAKGGQGTDPAQRVVGSVAFAAVARVVLVAAKVQGEEGKDTRILARSKSNIGPDDGGFEYHLEQTEPLPGIHASRIAWGKAVEGSARELLTDVADEESQADDHNDAADMLRAELSAEVWTNSNDAAKTLKDAGFSKKQIWQAGKKLHILRQKGTAGPHDAWYWRLPNYPGKAFVNGLEVQDSAQGSQGSTFRDGESSESWESSEVRV